MQWNLMIWFKFHFIETHEHWETKKKKKRKPGKETEGNMKLMEVWLHWYVFETLIIINNYEKDIKVRDFKIQG